MSKDKVVKYIAIFIVCIIVILIMLIVVRKYIYNKSDYSDYAYTPTITDTDYDNIKIFDSNEDEEMNMVIDYFHDMGLSGTVVKDDFYADSLSEFLWQYANTLEVWYGISSIDYCYEAVVVDGEVVINKVY